MWGKVNNRVWNNGTEKFKLPIFYHTDFLSVTANVFNINVDYYIFEKKGKVLAFGAFYVKKSNIIIPESFTFTALWFSDKLSDVAYIETATALVALLKNNYSKIQLRLNPLIQDIRPFFWANFKIENKYTYIKKDTIESHYSISKNLSKLPQDYYIFKVENIDNHSLGINLDFLKKIGFSTAICDLYKSLLTDWDKLCILKAFNVYRQNELVCSNIVVLDKDDDKAYTILLNNVSAQEKYAHTYLYQSIINWCKENNIGKIDLCGANLPSVAKFKSYFNPELKIYFIVKYRPLRGMFLNVKQSFIVMLKKIINAVSRI